MKTPLLEIRGVIFKHPLADRKYSRTVLDKVDLQVAEGEILILIGPSGAGKTTFLRLLNRLQDPQEGVIIYEGTDIRQRKVLALRREIALVPQEPFLLEGTVRENLLLPLDGKRKEKRIEERMLEVLASMGLASDFLNRSIHHLSLGEKQRVSIARALMVSPRVILLDEPTSALDPDNREVLSATIRRVNETAGTTVIVVTHLPEFAASLGGRCLTLKEGKIG